jgi:outer membrane protein OmpA-like peptidoglycan-associated protein
MYRKLFIALPIVVFALGGSTACATKKFVRTSVGEVNAKTDSLGKSLEETQERTRQNEAKIGDVDQRAQAASTAASAAATQAQQVAEVANTAAASATTTGTAAAAKANEVDLRTKKLLFEVVLSENAGDFKSGVSNLPDEAKARLDEMIAKLAADPNGAFFEIEGYTDDTGTKDLNQRLGLERAESVKMYLYEHHQVPLHKMNVISYGQDKPAAPNKTREGRAKNRRVVIQVLA